MGKYRWRLMIIATTLGAVAGCQANVPEARQEAYKRWYQTRAQMLYGVAVEHFKVGQLDLARNKATEALALDEEHFEARMLLGKVLIEQGHHKLAIAELNKARDAKPKLTRVCYLLGVAQEKDGRFAEALESYRRAYALDNTNVAAVLAAAEVLVLMGRVREAQLYAESYLSLASEEPGLYELAGRLAMMSRQYEKAVEYYQMLCDLAYKNVRYKEALGRAQYFAGKFDRAMETFTALLGTSGYSGPAWLHTMLGDCYLATGRCSEARDSYYKATQLTPSDAGVWANLAKAALTLGDNHRAILSARQSLQLTPNSLDATLVLGYAMLRTGQVARVVSLLTQATAAHPENVALRCLLGRAHAAAGNEAEAMRCYGAALKFDPSNRLARELLAGAGQKKLSKAG